MMEKVTISEKQEQTINEFKNALAGFSEDVLAEVIRGNYEVDPEFKAEDWVVYMKKDDYREKVAKTTHVGLREYTVQEGPNNFYTGNIKGLLRHATPEEIKAEQERRAWAKIGREVGEFRIGDAYMNKRGLIHDIDFPERAEVIQKIYEVGALKGFYPAESFIKFGGGE